MRGFRFTKPTYAQNVITILANSKGKQNKETRITSNKSINGYFQAK